MQVILKGVKSLCLTKHDQSLARWQFALNFVNLGKRLFETICRFLGACPNYGSLPGLISEKY